MQRVQNFGSMRKLYLPAPGTTQWEMMSSLWVLQLFGAFLDPCMCYQNTVLKQIVISPVKKSCLLQTRGELQLNVCNNGESYAGSQKWRELFFYRVEKEIERDNVNKASMAFSWQSCESLSLVELLASKKGESFLFLLGSIIIMHESSPSGLWFYFNWVFSLLIFFTMKKSMFSVSLKNVELDTKKIKGVISKFMLRISISKLSYIWRIAVYSLDIKNWFGIRGKWGISCTEKRDQNMP